jgi:hypothetical protein
MALPLYPPPAPQSIGEVLDAAFRIFQGTLLRCLPYGLLSVLAGQAASIHDLAVGKPLQRYAWRDPEWLAWDLVGVLLSAILSSAMTLRQDALAQGHPSAVGAELHTALQRLPRLILVGLLWALAVAAGLVLFVVPGVYLSVALLFAWPAVLLRNQGGLEALRYSRDLVRGSWWRASAIFAVVLIVLLVFYGVVGVGTGVVLSLTGVRDLAVVTAVSTTAALVMGAIGTPFTTAVVLALFAELRVRREGLDLERRIEAMAAS